MSIDDLFISHHNCAADGQPLVIVHGAPDRSKNFNRVVQLLDDFRIITYDRRGYGKSLAAIANGEGFQRHAEDLVEILDDTPSVVVGQSAGGAISMLAATLAPELFLSLGVWEPPMVPYKWWREEKNYQQTLRQALFNDTEALAEMMNRMFIGDKRWESLQPQTREMLLAEGYSFRCDMRSQLTEFMDIEKITCPLLLGFGNTDVDPILIESYRRMGQVLGCHVWEVPEANHTAHTSHPEIWAQFARRTANLSTSVAK